MTIIGITGLPGSGKTTVSKFFEKQGFVVIDCDGIAKKQYKKKQVMDKVKHAFNIKKKSLSRKEMDELFFKNKETVQKINLIIWPIVEKEAEKIMKKSKKGVIDSALLFEAGLDKFCDLTIFVVCPEKERLKRMQKRGFDKKDIEKRILFQLKEKEKEKFCDIKICNSGKLNELNKKTKSIIKKINYAVFL